MMGTAERRNSIMKILCRRRHETINNLASEFGVSDRTIRRDIEVLSLTEPIYTQSGRYGGVYIVEGYLMSHMYMTREESEVLHRLYETVRCQHKCVLTQRELEIFRSIVLNYTKPIIKKGK